MTNTREVITIWRASVCMGDDYDAPHEFQLLVEGSETLESVLERVLLANYLAQIGGGKATWIFQANSRPLAVVAQQWHSPKFLTALDQPAVAFRREASPDFYFLYWCQTDPNLVWECLHAGKPLPNKYSGSKVSIAKRE